MKLNPINLTKIPTTLAATAIAAALSIPSAEAALISIDPATGVTASSEIPGFDRIDDYIVSNGLNGSGEHSSGADGVAWLSTGNTPTFGNEDTDPSVTFDLGAVYTINSFHVWNYNENATGIQMTRGVDAVSVEYGTTAGLGSTVPGITNFAIADGTPTYTGEDFSGFTPFNARYIKFDIDSNHGDVNVFYGLSEVQFDGVLVPEPGSMALFGLGGLALILRRRRR